MLKRLNFNSTLHGKYSDSTLRSSSSFNIFSASINDTGISSEATSFWVLFNLRERKWKGLQFIQSSSIYLTDKMPCLPYLEIVKINNKVLQLSWFCQSIISLLHLLKKYQCIQQVKRLYQSAYLSLFPSLLPTCSITSYPMVSAS